MSAREGIVERIEQLRPLDAVSVPLQRLVGELLPEGSAARDVLAGDGWLGHPLHPALTDVVVGSWTSALALDALGGEAEAPAAEALVALGVLAAVPTAAAGLCDWLETEGGTRRLGSVHAVANSTALALQVASLLARRRGDRERGLALSAVAFGIAGFSAWLGGHLTYRRGVRVRRVAGAP